MVDNFRALRNHLRVSKHQLGPLDQGDLSKDRLGPLAKQLTSWKEHFWSLKDHLISSKEHFGSLKDHLRPWLTIKTPSWTVKKPAWIKLDNQKTTQWWPLLICPTKTNITIISKLDSRDVGPFQKHWLQWLPNSPNVPIHGGGAHDTFGDRDNALHRLGLDGEAIAGGSKAVPVEDVDGPLAGAANYLPAPLH